MDSLLLPKVHRHSGFRVSKNLAASRPLLNSLRTSQEMRAGQVYQYVALVGAILGGIMVVMV
jgi:hypothetical protein